MNLRAKLVIAVMAAAPMVLTATVADAVTTAKPVAAKLSQCDGSRTVKVGNGWSVTTPGVWESTSTNCNLKYGDLPHRDADNPFGDPAASIKTLQRDLNYCYGTKLVVDGKYGAKTRDAIRAVQRKHKLTADGVYGPQTRSAMNWRLFHVAKGIYSQNCYSPI